MNLIQVAAAVAGHTMDALSVHVDIIYLIYNYKTPVSRSTVILQVCNKGAESSSGRYQLT